MTLDVPAEIARRRTFVIISHPDAANPQVAFVWAAAFNEWVFWQ